MGIIRNVEVELGAKLRDQREAQTEERAKLRKWQARLAAARKKLAEGAAEGAPAPPAHVPSAEAKTGPRPASLPLNDMRLPSHASTERVRCAAGAEMPLMSAEELDALVLDDLQYKCAWHSSFCITPCYGVAKLCVCHRYFGGGPLRLTGWRTHCPQGCMLGPRNGLSSRACPQRCVDGFGAQLEVGRSVQVLSKQAGCARG